MCMIRENAEDFVTKTIIYCMNGVNTALYSTVFIVTLYYLLHWDWDGLGGISVARDNAA